MHDVGDQSADAFQGAAEIWDIGKGIRCRRLWRKGEPLVWS